MARRLRVLRDPTLNQDHLMAPLLSLQEGFTGKRLKLWI